jgi:hypothetical protein
VVGERRNQIPFGKSTESVLAVIELVYISVLTLALEPILAGASTRNKMLYL